MFSLAPRSSLRLAGLVISNGKSSRCNLSSDVRQAVTKEERTARRAARKERANAYLSSIGSGAAAESAATTGKAADVSSSSGGLGFDASRLGWYAAVLVPTAFIGWGVYDENSPPAQFSRFIGLTDKFDEFAKPTRTKLLPDWNQIPNIPPDFPAPPTLVLDLESTLVCCTWDRKYGWRYAKRPGVDKFLSTLAQYYEIVIFTPSPDGLAGPVLDSLDSKGYVMHRLHREATHYHNGVHCKDLSWLNRPLRKIVVLDDDPAALQFQPENLIRVKPYDNPTDREDNTLERIMPLLVEISREGYDDIPNLLSQFKGMDADEIADEFERRVSNVRVRRNEITQRGLGGFASGRDLPPPELPPELSGVVPGQQTQLTAKDLVGDAPKSEASGAGVIGWLQRRQKEQEEHNKEKFGLWNEVMMKKQAEKRKRMEKLNQQQAA
ncbi:hypothetical protein ACHAWO_005364 [Cyclotella atomus]|uniref:Mitochondrial import inner membrane translocase subunit TIM50 n=1 Tax=Cyclotella atomus TaxID=382360 RepID=A0ABD3Q4E7_9STRA